MVPYYPLRERHAVLARARLAVPRPSPLAGGSALGHALGATNKSIDHLSVELRLVCWRFAAQGGLVRGRSGGSTRASCTGSGRRSWRTARRDVRRGGSTPRRAARTSLWLGI